LTQAEQEQKQQNRFLVTPGDKVVEGEYKLLSPLTAYRLGNAYYASVVGLAEVNDAEKTLRVIPLEGFYYPKVGDLVIGIVENVGVTNWEVDIKAPFPGVLYAVDFLGRPVNTAKESLKDYLDVGDVVICKIEAFDRTRDPVLTAKGKDLGKVVKGALVEINPVKIPRVIGKKGSMQSMIENETGCKLVVANNGRILINCEDRAYEDIVVLAIRKIEKEAHTSGLTDRIKEFIALEKVRRGLIGGKEREA